MRESLRQSATDSVINLDKAPSLTSYDAVEEIKRLLGVRKVGHAGSLDPFATGVLLVCTGRATKLTRFLMELEKAYSGTIRLGFETDTDDSTGRAVSETTELTVTKEELLRAAATFTGEVLQRPPRVSALKLNGRRLYEMARSGESFEPEARSVTIHEFEITAFDSPDVEFRLRCSRGTYVRSVARDLGRLFGCGGHLRELRRTKVGQFAVEEAVTLDRLRECLGRPGEQAENGPAERVPGLWSMEEALSFLPGLFLRKEAVVRVLDGRSPGLEDIEKTDGRASKGGRVRVMSPEGELLAIGTVPASEGEPVVRLERVLARRRLPE
ncbi:MAG: tRNA pseudouridine(55) synthase TruB [Candidatus Eisenbacteria bacterium]|nr:tRNA pseudouridine(55) synthase TruB [Candidatus Eisenbacteria bacterium]